MNQPYEGGWAGMVSQCRCSHCGEMYASNYIHTCDAEPNHLLQRHAMQQTVRALSECPICASGSQAMHGCIGRQR